ncbi:uncharacterized protein KY384_005703 [Bacidia gigantensis]|uniref:uncharacterized protein n=1 Tax=Bacidia gigantensis TaxID=2732470 RepID=UPI001D03CEEF|nr:uncharacterized protein KY384_005703 [Bacidia gigantensis]KAG8529068.1 hypothetical protein KY384_005703 [Bacidia gigantensis]
MSIDPRVAAIHDWQVANGSLLKRITGENAEAYPVNVALKPSHFPRACFVHAQELQTIFNRLYAAVSSDEAWLEKALSNLLQTDTLARRLWDIHKEAKRDGLVQPISMGVFRSDYMVQDAATPNDRQIIKQVEFNTFSVAGGVHANKISDMHRLFERIGSPPSTDLMPLNDTKDSIVAAFERAHRLYARENGGDRRLAVMMVVQPNNFNVCDECPIVYGLWYRGIPCYRVEWGDQLETSVSYGSSSKELLLRLLDGESMEISIVYYRAGYEEKEYDQFGCEIRCIIEQSRAIKCPSILGHLSTMKVIQQKLSERQHLEHFLNPEDAEKVLAVCCEMFPMDTSEMGMKARSLALDRSTAPAYVLKPSLEGGGNNVYGNDIPGYLGFEDEESWSNYILMAKIQPPKDVTNTLLSCKEGVYEGGIVSELGIFGACVWKTLPQDQDERAGPPVQILEDETIGFSLKSKRWDVDEMSVVKGYGCFDSPKLVP